MARPTTARSTKMLIKLGDGASPEVFTAPCGLNTRGFGRTATLNEFNVGDCDNPDLPAWVERVKAALSSTITGSGLLAGEAIAAYEAAFASPDPINVQVTLDFATGARTYQGAYHVSNFQINGPDGELIQVELELQSSGEVLPVTP